MAIYCKPQYSGDGQSGRMRKRRRRRRTSPQYAYVVTSPVIDDVSRYYIMCDNIL